MHPVVARMKEGNETSEWISEGLKYGKEGKNRIKSIFIFEKDKETENGK